jgi:hypothetical protein
VSNRAPESTLRRLVDELAHLREKDVSAILATLEPAERETVDRLLKQHAGYPEILHSVMEGAAYDASKLSPWLIDRLRADSNAGALAISPASREALRACATRLYPLPADTPSPRRFAKHMLRVHTQ